MNLKDQRQALIETTKSILSRAEAAGRELTPGEQDAVNLKMAEISALGDRIDGAAKSADLMARIGALDPTKDGAFDDDLGERAKSLGDHFAKAVGPDGFSRLKAVSGYTAYAPEFKAATDAQLSPAALAPAATDIDTTLVRGYRRPTVSDLMGAGSLSGNAVTYFVEGSVEGAFTTVAEGGQKPQLHQSDPTAVTDALKKIAAWWDTSDEMVEDLPFMVSEINNRGLYLLSIFEETQLLSGNGSGTNVQGLLNRSGVQALTQASTGFTGESAQDAIFRGITSVQTATGLTADGIIINPADYMALRLAKDANNQYYGGGFFYGEYGNGAVSGQPNLWGIPTVVSAAVPAKTVVIGALKAATTVYRKGGVRVESTNSDLGKFTKNVITTRIEERIALAVRNPAAVVKLTLS